MIGLFDSGSGGLTVRRALVDRFPDEPFVYLGDHANAPYGDRPSEDVLELTETAVAWLFDAGARLVLLACNTATAVACRSLQQVWLPQSGRIGVNVLGIIAPTVEAATQTPWAVQTPQYPQKNRTDTIVVFGTTRTVSSAVYTQEIVKRCPLATVVEVACPELVGAIETGAPEELLDGLVAGYVAEAVARTARPPELAILGCTHYALVAEAFDRHLPSATRVLSQPRIVADALADYLERHPGYLTGTLGELGGTLFTTGDPRTVSDGVEILAGEPLAFTRVELRPARVH